MKSILLFPTLLLAATTIKISQADLPGQTKFASHLYTELAKLNFSNFVASPLSVDIVLALIHNGARGKTAQQLSKGLGLPETDTEIQQIFSSLISALKTNNNYSLSSANKIYLEETFEIAEKFRNVAVDVYDAEVETINFSASKTAATKINKWVEDKTQNKIKELVAKEDLEGPVELVAINALYFKGDWVKQFIHKRTKKLPFFINKKEKRTVNMMHQTRKFNYYECSKLKAKILELPYIGGDVTMTIVLPNEIEGLPKLESKITEILPVRRPLRMEKVNVALPKFTIETSIKFNPILKSLGIVDAFESSADFTGIGSKNESLQIDAVVQKAFIEVDEKGTTAAAATGVSITSKSAAKQFNADHPFIYYLSHSTTILFVGRYSKP